MDRPLGEDDAPRSSMSVPVKDLVMFAGGDRERKERRQAAFGFAHFSTDKESQEQIVTMKRNYGVDALLSLLTSTDAICQRYAALSLGNIVSNETLVAKLISKGVLEQLLPLAVANTTELETKRYCVLAVANMAARTETHSILMASLPSLVPLVDSTDPEIQKCACLVLHNLSSNKSILLKLDQCITPLINVLANKHPLPDTKLHALACLCGLCVQDLLKLRTINEGALGQIVHIIQEPVSDHVLVQAAAFLSSLSSLYETHVDLLQPPVLNGLFVVAMGDVVEAQTHAGNALANLCSNASNNATLVAFNAVANLITMCAFQEHGVKAAAARALANLASDVNLHDELLEQGCMESLISCMKESHSDCQLFACLFFAILCDDRSVHVALAIPELVQPVFNILAAVESSGETKRYALLALANLAVGDVSHDCIMAEVEIQFNVFFKLAAAHDMETQRYMALLLSNLAANANNHDLLSGGETLQRVATLVVSDSLETVVNTMSFLLKVLTSDEARVLCATHLLDVVTQVALRWEEEELQFMVAALYSNLTTCRQVRQEHSWAAVLDRVSKFMQADHVDIQLQAVSCVSNLRDLEEVGHVVSTSPILSQLLRCLHSPDLEIQAMSLRVVATLTAHKVTIPHLAHLEAVRAITPFVRSQHAAFRKFAFVALGNYAAHSMGSFDLMDCNLVKCFLNVALDGKCDTEEMRCCAFALSNAVFHSRNASVVGDTGVLVSKTILDYVATGDKATQQHCARMLSNLTSALPDHHMFSYPDVVAMITRLAQSHDPLTSLYACEALRDLSVGHGNAGLFAQAEIVSFLKNFCEVNLGGDYASDDLFQSKAEQVAALLNNLSCHEECLLQMAESDMIMTILQLSSACDRASARTYLASALARLASHPGAQRHFLRKDVMQELLGCLRYEDSGVYGACSVALSQLLSVRDVQRGESPGVDVVLFASLLDHPHATIRLSAVWSLALGSRHEWTEGAQSSFRDDLIDLVPRLTVLAQQGDGRGSSSRTQRRQKPTAADKDVLRDIRRYALTTLVNVSQRVELHTRLLRFCRPVVHAVYNLQHVDDVVIHRLSALLLANLSTSLALHSELVQGGGCIARLDFLIARDDALTRQYTAMALRSLSLTEVFAKEIVMSERLVPLLCLRAMKAPRELAEHISCIFFHLSHHPALYEVLLHQHTVPGLLHLLLHKDAVQVQLFAASALLNLLETSDCTRLLVQHDLGPSVLWSLLHPPPLPGTLKRDEVAAALSDADLSEPGNTWNPSCDFRVAGAVVKVLGKLSRSDGGSAKRNVYLLEEPLTSRHAAPLLSFMLHVPCTLGVAPSASPLAQELQRKARGSPLNSTQTYEYHAAVLLHTLCEDGLWCKALLANGVAGVVFKLCASDNHTVHVPALRALALLFVNENTKALCRLEQCFQESEKSSNEAHRHGTLDGVIDIFRRLLSSDAVETRLQTITCVRHLIAYSPFRERFFTPRSLQLVLDCARSPEQLTQLQCAHVLCQLASGGPELAHAMLSKHTLSVVVFLADQADMVLNRADSDADGRSLARRISSLVVLFLSNLFTSPHLPVGFDAAECIALPVATRALVSEDAVVRSLGIIALSAVDPASAGSLFQATTHAVHLLHELTHDHGAQCHMNVARALGLLLREEANVHHILHQENGQAWRLLWRLVRSPVSGVRVTALEALRNALCCAWEGMEKELFNVDEMLSDASARLQHWRQSVIPAKPDSPSATSAYRDGDDDVEPREMELWLSVLCDLAQMSSVAQGMCQHDQLIPRLLELVESPISGQLRHLSLCVLHNLCVHSSTHVALLRLGLAHCLVRVCVLDEEMLRLADDVSVAEHRRTLHLSAAVLCCCSLSLSSQSASLQHSGVFPELYNLVNMVQVALRMPCDDASWVACVRWLSLCMARVTCCEGYVFSREDACLTEVLSPLMRVQDRGVQTYSLLCMASWLCHAQPEVIGELHAAQPWANMCMMFQESRSSLHHTLGAGALARVIGAAGGVEEGRKELVKATLTHTAWRNVLSRRIEDDAFGAVALAAARLLHQVLSGASSAYLRKHHQELISTLCHLVPTQDEPDAAHPAVKALGLFVTNFDEMVYLVGGCEEGARCVAWVLSHLTRPHPIALDTEASTVLQNVCAGVAGVSNQPAMSKRLSEEGCVEVLINALQSYSQRPSEDMEEEDGHTEEEEQEEEEDAKRSAEPVNGDHQKHAQRSPQHFALPDAVLVDMCQVLHNCCVGRVAEFVDGGGAACVASMLQQPQQPSIPVRFACMAVLCGVLDECVADDAISTLKRTSADLLSLLRPAHVQTAVVASLTVAVCAPVQVGDDAAQDERLNLCKLARMAASTLDAVTKKETSFLAALVHEHAIERLVPCLALRARSAPGGKDRVSLRQSPLQTAVHEVQQHLVRVLLRVSVDADLQEPFVRQGGAQVVFSLSDSDEMGQHRRGMRLCVNLAKNARCQSHLVQCGMLQLLVRVRKGTDEAMDTKKMATEAFILLLENEAILQQARSRKEVLHTITSVSKFGGDVEFKRRAADILQRLAQGDDNG